MVTYRSKWDAGSAEVASVGRLRLARLPGTRTEAEAIANIARKLDVSPEEALQSANRKFMRRFEVMERSVRSEGRNLDQLTLEQMDALWDEAKAAERL